MTTEEIFEPEKLLAAMKDDLSVLTGASDPDKLTALVLETVPRMIQSYDRLVRPIPMTIVSGADRSLFVRPLIMLLSAAEMVELRSDWKPKLAGRVAEYAPQIAVNLAKTAKVVQRQ